MYEWYDRVLKSINAENPSLPIYISDAWDLSTALKYAAKANAQNMNPVIVDTHKYFCFSDADKQSSPQQIIDKVDIPEIQQGQTGSLIVGEYSCVVSNIFLVEHYARVCAYQI